MTVDQTRILNSLVTFAAENIPGGLTSEEQDVAVIVGLWAWYGVPVRPVCPYCNSAAPIEETSSWVKRHMRSRSHRLWWGLKTKINSKGT